MYSHINLDRQFSPVPADQDETENEESLSMWGHIKTSSWDELEKAFRCVILAEAGAGKTEEFRHQAGLLAEQGKPSFFIRIEDIDADFYKSFDIGDESTFERWLESTGEAWFFLDSVDEARLDSPRAFEKALRRFAGSIKNASHRAHVYISSRPYAWRPKEDRMLMDRILFHSAPKDKEHIDQQSDTQSALTVFIMRPLDRTRISRFCLDHRAEKPNRLLTEIGRKDLWSLAERPFDLIAILDKWAEDKALGSRLELLRHNIDKRLRDDHNTDRMQRQSLNIKKARKGARRIAAAVVLTGQAGINVPDAQSTKPGIDAESILPDWDSKNVRALLDMGIFNDVIYGAVRFRHREIRELLAAEWFDQLLKQGNSRYSIEALFFREHWGENIVTPRLRPVLSWLILLDEEVRRKALELAPELAVEGGDPSHLPLSQRQQILKDIVRRIVNNEDDRSARDNNAIARIAHSDLSADALKLINEYYDNDEAIFFLGRLVWQGEMANCVEPLIAIAASHERGKYARIASARAVMTCGTSLQKKTLWSTLNAGTEKIPRELLAELVSEAKPGRHSIELLLASLDKLPPYKRFNSTGLSGALHELIQRPPTNNTQTAAISLLIDGLHGYLKRTPHVRHRECEVSQEYSWLLNPASHAVERLIEAHSSVALGPSALSIVVMLQDFRFWGSDDSHEYKDQLKSLAPTWPEFNDALYWASIARARIKQPARSTTPMTDDWPAFCTEHFWKFDSESFPRLCRYIVSRETQEERLIVLSTAFRIYHNVEKPKSILGRLKATVCSALGIGKPEDNPVTMLKSLKAAVAGERELKDQLNRLLNPPVSESTQRFQQKQEERRNKRNLEKEEQAKNRRSWIAELQKNPARIISSPNFKPGEFTDDQYWLLHESKDRDLKTNRSDGSNWQALIPEFGEAVAQAYRQAAMNHWRHYEPTLQSEGILRNNQTPYSLIFALVGLEIEAVEISDFPHHLTESEVRLALRYLTWELNGFPSWFESMYKAFPDWTMEAVLKELNWELENNNSETPMHYILHDLVYHASWLHERIAPFLQEWVENNPTRINSIKHFCLHILVNGGTCPNKLSALAHCQINQSTDPDNQAWWYALRVDCDPENGIPEVEHWLSCLEFDQAKHAAQSFLCVLMRTIRARELWPQIGHFRTVAHLKSLYILMHRYIRKQDDNQRADSGTYSPNSRDDAEEARNLLFKLLSEIPGKESYTSIKQLIDEHPNPTSSKWMAWNAYKKAETEGDLEPWSAEQVAEFDKNLLATPQTHRQLFDLAVHKLRDMKYWLERGNDSTSRTWQRAEEETEMRNLVANWLNQNCQKQYTTAQEPELANSQRMDIWLDNTNVKSPVPIELKLLDKTWSGPKLCERLRNQLAGGYLQEESAGCGVMLLVSQNIKPNKRWTIDGQKVGLTELARALKDHWQSVSGQFPGVEVIEVIVIDLAQRGKISVT